MKHPKGLVALVAGLMLVSPPARAEILEWHNVPAAFLTRGIEHMTGKKVELEPELAGRLFTVVAPRDMAMKELLYYARAVLAIDGVMWVETDSKIELSSYLTIDEVAAVKKSIGPKTLAEGRTRRRSVILPPAKIEKIEEQAKFREGKPDEDPPKRRQVVLPAREETEEMPEE